MYRGQSRLHQTILRDLTSRSRFPKADSRWVPRVFSTMIHLKAVISGHGLDPSGLARNWRKKEKLVDLIVERAEARGRKGEVFRA